MEQVPVHNLMFIEKKAVSEENGACRGVKNLKQ